MLRKDEVISFVYQRGKEIKIMKEIIKTYGLTKKYKDVFSVNNIDMTVKEGSIYGFLGPNGAGKSTTLKMLLGLVNPTRGEIDIFGKRLDAKKRIEILKDIGSLIESPSYYGHLTGRENLKIVQTILGIPEKNIDKILKIVRLDGQEGKRVDKYSLGMKQRLGIASAMLSFPKMIILDEPTNGLDPAGIQEMRELIISLPKEYGMTVLVSSHLLSEIDQIATDVGIIAKGKLLFQNNIEFLRAMGKKSIILKTDNNERANNILTHIGIDAENEENFLRISETQDNKIIYAVSTLCKENIGVLRVEESHKSIEDIFLDMTKTEVSL